MRLAVPPLVLGLLLAGPVIAQPFPTVTSFPLELKRAPPGFTAQDSAALNAELERLILKAGGDVPDSAQYASALTELRRQDCDRDDECLKQLAQLARTLYALYAEIDNTLAGNVVATGRVVRSDGVAMGRSKTVSLPRGKGKFSAVAGEALERLLAELGVGQLPPQRTVQPDPLPPPPPPPAVRAPVVLTGPRRNAVISGAVAGVAAVGAAVAYGFAFDLHQRLTVDVWPPGPDAFGAARRGEALQWVSAISFAVAAGATAVALWFLTGEVPPAAGASRASQPLGTFAW